MSIRKVDLSEEMGLNRRDSLARLEVGSAFGHVEPAWSRYGFTATGLKTGWKPFDLRAAMDSMRGAYDDTMSALLAKDDRPSPILALLAKPGAPDTWSISVKYDPEAP